jgi:archaemetzincin
MYPRVELRQPIDLPQKTWNSARKRYRADSLINYLKSICPPDAVILGLTNKDISTTKGKVADWGVMGLGFCPGRINYLKWGCMNWGIHRDFRIVRLPLVL